ncbi:hypothetical protein K5549_002407 [Capra hircus]|uniref:Large ribosomal subunit protein uL15/eL18 domain-containing protein n=1 Tax=Capra hircus TaxID=9925 RepID=A0A452GB94_CAPHI|nr:hypothetical protein K5549_002407 [Capra hircus]
MNHTNWPLWSLSRMIQKTKLPGQEGKTAVVMGTVTNGVRLCALRVSGHAQSRILKAAAKILTFDQLTLASPKGCGHFGKASVTRHSHLKPYVHSKGRKLERARGQRASHGCKN